MERIAVWFLVFMFYAFAGWLLEVAMSLLQRRKFVNRGFLIGPICPIYGVGALALSLLVDPGESPLVIFCVAVVGSAILEYTVSYFMEKIFRVRWWDYTERLFNLNGRICFESIFGFGIIGVLILKLLTPALLRIFSGLSAITLLCLSVTLALWLICDIALSLWLVLGVRVTVSTVQRDATEEIAERVHEILMGKGKLNRRLVKAFPKQSPSKKPASKSTTRRKSPRRQS